MKRTILAALHLIGAAVFMLLIMARVGQATDLHAPADPAISVFAVQGGMAMANGGRPQGVERFTFVQRLTPVVP